MTHFYGTRPPSSEDVPARSTVAGSPDAQWGTYRQDRIFASSGPSFIEFFVAHTGGDAAALLGDVCSRSGSVTPLTRPRDTTTGSFAARRGAHELLAAIQSAFGLTITCLAAVLRVERPTIYAWLKETSMPSPANAARLDKVAELADYWLRASEGRQYVDLDRLIVQDRSLNALLRDDHLRTFVIERTLAQIAKTPDAIRSPSISLRDLARQRGIQTQAAGDLDVLTGRRLGPEE